MPPEGFESPNPVIERPQTHALDRAATGVGCLYDYKYQIMGAVVVSTASNFCV
jgi:hypothetical protein